MVGGGTLVYRACWNRMVGKGRWSWVVVVVPVRPRRPHRSSRLLQQTTIDQRPDVIALGRKSRKKPLRPHLVVHRLPGHRTGTACSLRLLLPLHQQVGWVPRAKDGVGEVH